MRAMGRAVSRWVSAWGVTLVWACGATLGTLSSRAQTAADPLAAPTIGEAAGISQRQVLLAWTLSSSNATGLVVERATAAAGFTVVAQLGASATRWVDTGLTADTDYSYRLQATNAAGVSDYSSAQTAQTFPYPPYRIGLNFPWRNPESTPVSLVLPMLNELGVSGVRQLTFGDVSWQDVQPDSNTWDFATTDAVISATNRFLPMPTLYGISAGENDQVGLQVPWKTNWPAPVPRGGRPGWYASRDSVDSSNYVTTVVQRYRAVTRYWEIANEMELKLRPIGLPAADFAEFLRLNHDWVKAADPTAVVLLPSLLGTYGYPMTNSFPWLRTVLDLGGASSFDVMAYHDYNSWWTLAAHYDSLHTLLTNEYRVHKPIWVSETSISSDDTNRTSITPSYASTDEQAADTWRRTCLLFGKGADLVNWHSFWSSGGDSEWRDFGLLDPRGRKKKSYHSFQLLLRKIEGFDQARLLTIGDTTDDNTRGGSGAWAVEFTWTNNVTRWVLWSPDRQPYTLTGLTGRSSLSTIEVVPHTLSADGESALFATNTIAVTDGQVVFTNLTGSPLVVEAADSSPVPTDAYTRWIQGYFGADSAATAKEADPDADGVDNWAEYVAQTGPNDPTSRFTLRAARGAGSSTLLILSATSTNRLYSLHFRPRIEGAGWQLYGRRPGTGGDLVWSVTQSTNRLFYRAAVALPGE